MNNLYKALIPATKDFCDKQKVYDTDDWEAYSNQRTGELLIRFHAFLSSVPTMDQIYPKKPNPSDYIGGVTNANYQRDLKIFKLGGLFVGDNLVYIDEPDKIKILDNEGWVIVSLELSPSIADLLFHGAKLNPNHPDIPEHLQDVLPEIFGE